MYSKNTYLKSRKDKITMKKLILCGCLLSAFSMQSFAATSTFKVVKNDHQRYTEESIRMQTNKGPLIIYSVNMTPKMYRVFANLKKNQCVSVTISSKFEKHEGEYVLDDVTKAKKVKCV